MALSERISVILVEPRYPGNIGSVARAMANTGFGRLILVKPCPTDHPEARQMSLGAWPIIERAGLFPDLESALAGFQYVVATTCRGGKLRREARGPRRLSERVLERAAENRVALVFGPEDRGLTNEELTLCHDVATIPAHPDFTSLNLSHAVMVVLWEIWFRQLEVAPPPSLSGRALADSRKLEGMYRHLEEVLMEVGFLQPENPQRMIRALKMIFNRAGLEDREVRIIRGILRQFDWYLRKKKPKP